MTKLNPTAAEGSKRSATRTKQFAMIRSEKSAFGGDLRNTRAGRSKSRPLSTRETMHLVLRSTQARGVWSFRNAKNNANITRIVAKFASAYGVRVLSMANVGNHLHLQIKLGNRFTYNAFIRAITGAIAQAVTGRTRWATKQIAAFGSKNTDAAPTARDASDVGERSTPKLRFWDHRPFTRIVQSFRGYLKLKDYVRINQLEGSGYPREQARMMMDVEKIFDEPLRPIRNGRAMRP